MSDIPLTPTVFHVLLALARADEQVLHGYAIAQDAEEASDGAVRMGPGTLYGSLRRLQDDGLITEAPDPGRDAAHAERRRYYRITAAGRATLRAETERLSRAVTSARAALAGAGASSAGSAGSANSTGSTGSAGTRSGGEAG